MRRVPDRLACSGLSLTIVFLPPRQDGEGGSRGVRSAVGYPAYAPASLIPARHASSAAGKGPSARSMIPRVCAMMTP